MYKRYVLRAKNKSEYYLEKIKPEEILRSFILGEGGINHSIKYTIYRDLAKIINELFTMLSEQEVEVIKNRFGFYGRFCSLREVGRKMELTGERVRQIENKALRKLRHPSHSRNLFRVSERDDIMTLEEKEIYLKSIIIDKISAYLSGHSSKAGFFLNILETNELVMELDNCISTTIASDILLDDMEFGIRTYNCLKRRGIKTLADLLLLKEEDLMKIRNLGRKSTEEILRKLEVYRTREMKQLIEKKVSDKYETVKIKYKNMEKIYKFKTMSINEKAECIYEILVEDCSKNGVIIDYEMSFELKCLLLFKGYFFVENIIEDANCIMEELKLGMYEKYAVEFNIVAKKIRECIDNEENAEVIFTIVKSKAAKNIINRNPKTREELFGCFKTGDREYDRNLRNIFDEEFPDYLKINISENITLSDIGDDEIMDIEDEEISERVDS